MFSMVLRDISVCGWRVCTYREVDCKLVAVEVFDCSAGSN